LFNALSLPGLSFRATLRHYIPNLVFGANDGIITTFAVVAGVVGAGLDPRIILILGFANLLADGFSMGASNYLSIRSEVDGGHGSSKQEGIMHGSATFLAFVVVGAVPLSAYLFPVAAEYRFSVTVALTLLVLFAVGAARALVIEKPWWRGGIEMFLVGATAAGVAYMIGALVATLTGGQVI
jgi:VIT1/CCC1 family predicted Fe2+/Mn2+ transporter